MWTLTVGNSFSLCLTLGPFARPGGSSTATFMLARAMPLLPPHAPPLHAPPLPAPLAQCAEGLGLCWVDHAARWRALACLNLTSAGLTTLPAR